MTVFYADDDADDQEIFTAAVNEAEPHATVLLVNNGVEAIKLLKTLPIAPEIIFLDMNCRSYRCIYLQ